MSPDAEVDKLVTRFVGDEKLRSSTPVKLGDFIGRQVEAKLKDGRNSTMRIWLVGNHYYCAAVIYKKDTCSVATDFFNSFTLLKVPR